MKQKLTSKMNVAFTEKIGEIIETLAGKEQCSKGDIIRECVEKELPKLRKRIQRKHKKGA